MNDSVDVWAGNAIDAAGVFPNYFFTDSTTGYYRGLDKLDSSPTAGGAASYYYTSFIPGNPDFTTFAVGTVETT